MSDAHVFVIEIREIFSQRDYNRNVFFLFFLEAGKADDDGILIFRKNNIILIGRERDEKPFSSSPLTNVAKESVGRDQKRTGARYYNTRGVVRTGRGKLFRISVGDERRRKKTA